MAREKYSYWRSFAEAIAALPDDKAGRLQKAINAAAFDKLGNPEDIIGDDQMLNLAFTMVAEQVKESVAISRRAAESGSRGGRPKKADGDIKKGMKSTPLSTPKSTPKRAPLSTPKRGAKSTPESTPESVWYGTVPYGKVGTVPLSGEAGIAKGSPLPPPVSVATSVTDGE